MQVRNATGSSFINGLKKKTAVQIQYSPVWRYVMARSGVRSSTRPQGNVHTELCRPMVVTVVHGRVCGLVMASHGWLPRNGCSPHGHAGHTVPDPRLVPHRYRLGPCTGSLHHPAGGACPQSTPRAKGQGRPARLSLITQGTRRSSRAAVQRSP